MVGFFFGNARVVFGRSSQSTPMQTASREDACTSSASSGAPLNRADPVAAPTRRAWTHRIPQIWSAVRGNNYLSYVRGRPGPGSEGGVPGTDTPVPGTDTPVPGTNSGVPGAPTAAPAPAPTAATAAAEAPAAPAVLETAVGENSIGEDGRATITRNLVDLSTEDFSRELLRKPLRFRRPSIRVGMPRILQTSYAEILTENGCKGLHKALRKYFDSEIAKDPNITSVKIHLQVFEKPFKPTSVGMKVVDSRSQKERVLRFQPQGDPLSQGLSLTSASDGDLSGGSRGGSSATCPPSAIGVRGGLLPHGSALPGAGGAPGEAALRRARVARAGVDRNIELQKFCNEILLFLESAIEVVREFAKNGAEVGLVLPEPNRFFQTENPVFKDYRFEARYLEISSANKHRDKGQKISNIDCVNIRKSLHALLKEVEATKPANSVQSAPPRVGLGAKMGPSSLGQPHGGTHNLRPRSAKSVFQVPTTPPATYNGGAGPSGNNGGDNALNKVSDDELST